MDTVVRIHPQALCEECPLYGQPVAPSLQPKTPQVKCAIVSRSPGYHEGIAGKPFSGPSGKVLDHLLKENGVTRDECLVTNTVLCAPDSPKVPPEAIKACAPRLAEELRDIQLVIACGSEAVNELVGRGSIDRHRGYRINRNGRVVVATNNPALVLRDDSTFPNLRKDFKRAFNPLPPPTFPEVVVIEDEREATNYVSNIYKTEGRIAVDIETRGGLTHKATLVSIQFAIDGGTSTVIGERGGFLDRESAFTARLRELLESQEHSFVWHGGKYDTKILRHTYGINARVDHDTMLLSYALDERSGTDERIGVHGLEYLLMDEFGWPHYCPPSVEKAKKTGIVEDYDAFYKYAGLDVGGTFQLFEAQKERALRDHVYDRPYLSLLIPANEFLTELELHGIVYDVDRAADVYEFEVYPELHNLTWQMREQLNDPILNPRSPTQMAVVFYDKFGIKHAMQKRPAPPQSKASTMERSVDDSARTEILEHRFTFRGETEHVRKGNIITTVQAPDALKQRQFIVDFVTKYDRFQELSKQASTYLVKMIERAANDPESRVYTQLNLHGTNSGRLSSVRPNLQNITRTKEGLPDIRKLFRSSPGRLLVSADYSQAELRCIATFSGDKELTRVYANDLDLHSETAKRFFGEDFIPEQRNICKNVNFGVFYRQTAETFQEKHGIPARKAQPYIDWVWQTFVGVKEWELGIEKEIKTRGVLVSPFGRKRRFHLLTRENVQAAFREGINFDPQSTASDFTLSAAIRLNGEIDRDRASIVLLVHDSILADVQEAYVDEYKKVCQQVMEACPREELDWTLPFKVDIGIGPTWGECK